MNIDDIRLIYEYNYWANHKILASSQKVGPAQFTAPGEFSMGGLHGTLVHILDAEYGWRSLFQAGAFTPELTPKDLPDLAAIETRCQQEEAAMRAYIGGLRSDDLAGHLFYTTDTGQKRDRILWHCLLHVVNHGTQHRSEAAAILTAFDASPGDLDFTVS